MLPENFNQMSLTDRGDFLRSALQKDCLVTFTKVDGTVREMPCTLRSDAIPPPPIHETNTDNPIDFPKVKKVNPEVLSVWCLDKFQWRSFKVMNVTDLKQIVNDQE